LFSRPLQGAWRQQLAGNSNPVNVNSPETPRCAIQAADVVQYFSSRLHASSSFESCLQKQKRTSVRGASPPE
jgi:hypothetical protein